MLHWFVCIYVLYPKIPTCVKVSHFLCVIVYVYAKECLHIFSSRLGKHVPYG